MARFCFVSLAAPGHCDFGGMGFLRTAQELARRGHDVRWVFSHHRYPFEQAKALVRRYEIPLEERHRFYLSVYAHHHREDPGANVVAFSEYLQAERYDCVVTDRIAIGAAFAAHRARIPWATVGTDGRAWSQRLYRWRFKAMFPGARRNPKVSEIAAMTLRDGFPRPAVRSRWATSPFLNISFFPRRFHQDSPVAALPKHSHFVGSGSGSKPAPERKRLLITFGNTFYYPLRPMLLEGLRPVIRERSIPTTVLAGGEGWMKLCRPYVDDLPSVTVEPWVPYEEAFGESRVAIGHGGVAYVWHGMLAGTPLLPVPFLDDQSFGAAQVERLGIGAAVVPRGLPWLAPGWQWPLTNRWTRWCSRFGDVGRRLDYRLNARELQRMLIRVLDDDAFVSHSVACSEAMRQGGGSEAAATLVERLAAERTLVSACVSPACCC